MVIGTAKAYSSGAIHEVMMEALHRFSSSVWPTSVPSWVFSMHKRLGVTHHVSTSCLCFVRMVQQCCSLPNLIKPVSFVACLAGTSAGTYTTLWLPQWRAYAHPHFATRKSAVNPTYVSHSHVSWEQLVTCTVGYMNPLLIPGTNGVE